MASTSGSQRRKDEEQAKPDDKRRMSRASRRMSRAASIAKDENLDEYERIVRYASTYREPGKDDEEAEEGELRRLWYAPWKKRRVQKRQPEGQQRFPDEWLLTDIKQGLSEQEVYNRRRRTGWNELTSEKENPIAKFLSYFQGPILYGEFLCAGNSVILILICFPQVMELAVLLSAGLEDWVDFGVIIGILLLNASVGWYQEKQAADIVASLKADIALKATVVREGREHDILARELVLGDVVGPEVLYSHVV
jgi:H+-transporting ATPase